MSTQMIACPSCQASNPAGAQFCGSCGAQLGSGAAAGVAGAPPVGVSYAGFWIRFVAWIIDALILIIPNVIIQLVVQQAAAVAVFQIALGAIYAVGFWVMEGATPGKMAMGLKVTTVDGQPLEFGPAVLRYIGYWVSGIILFIGFIMIAFNSEKRGLHDQIASTIVVKMRP